MLTYSTSTSYEYSFRPCRAHGHMNFSAVTDKREQRFVFMVKSDVLRLPLEQVGRRRLVKPFDVVVECVDDDEFTASVPELNIAMAGESAGEALLILKEHIADVYEILASCSALGPEPARQLSVLESRFGEEGRK